MLFEKKAGASDGLFKATREIAACFREKNLNFDTKRVNNMSVLETGMQGSNVSVINVLFISSDDDNDVAVRSFSIVPRIPEDRKAAILEVINNLNAKYRYAKFVLDDDNAVNVQYDIPASTEEVGKIAIEIFARFVQIIDDAYPVIMKSLWS